jgi:hypothetical protein
MLGALEWRLTAPDLFAAGVVGTTVILDVAGAARLLWTSSTLGLMPQRTALFLCL